MNWGKQNIMGWIACPQNSYVEALTLSASECVCGDRSVCEGESKTAVGSIYVTPRRVSLELLDGGSQASQDHTERGSPGSREVRLP